MQADRWIPLESGRLPVCSPPSSATSSYLLGCGSGESIGHFHREVFLEALFKDRILSVCTLAIVPAFHLAYRRKWIGSRKAPCS